MKRKIITVTFKYFIILLFVSMAILCYSYAFDFVVVVERKRGLFRVELSSEQINRIIYEYNIKTTISIILVKAAHHSVCILNEIYIYNNFSTP